MARKSPRAAAPILLGEALDLPEAAPLAAALLARRGQDITLDARAARRMGAQCLQVLLAAQTAWAEDGRLFRISGASLDFAAAVALLGAADLIPAPDSIPA